jgi:DNA primase
MIFNLDKAKNSRADTDEVLIVEGYMDVVSVYSSGIKNVIANSGTALTERQIDLIWKFFSNPIICLDGDESGQKAAFRIAEKLFPLINEKNKIYFSIMPDGKDPDDYIKQNGKDGLLSLLKDKQVIQSYIWNYRISKIDQSNPFEISNFEKEVKKLSYSIQDETLKKYVLEDFLEKIKKLTPIQSSRQNYNYTKFNKKKDYQILKETKLLHQKRKDLSKTQIIEFSILFIILNYFEIASKLLEQLSEIEFLSEKNESLKNIIIAALTEGNNKDSMQEKINTEYLKLIEEIKENSNIQMTTKDKTEQEILDLLNELILDFKEQNNLKKIESLEKKLINNLDESSYSELIKLKSQLNRD